MRTPRRGFTSRCPEAPVSASGSEANIFAAAAIAGGPHQPAVYSAGSALASSSRAMRELMGTSLSAARGRSKGASGLVPMSTRLTRSRAMYASP